MIRRTSACAPEGAAAGALPPALFRRSDREGLVRLALHLAVLALGLAGVALAGGSYAEPGYWIAAFALGLAGVCLFAPLHECVHRTAFARPWLNRAVGLAGGLVLLLPAGYFRAFHLEHHCNTQDPARDPELAAGLPDSLGAYLWRLSGVPYWVERITTIARHASGTVSERFVAPSGRAGIVREARAHVAAYAAVAALSVALGSDAVVRFWIVPVLLAQPFLRAFLMAEHGAMPLVPAMLSNSRTTRSNALVRLMTWNMSYHAEHHFRAAVPFHALPALRRHLGERAPPASPGYLHFHRQRLSAVLRGRAAARGNA